VPVVTLKGRMEQLKVPGISVAVFSEGRVEWTRAYGYADRERGIAATPHTLFEAGSISKALAALAALQLVERARSTSTGGSGSDGSPHRGRSDGPSARSSLSTPGACHAGGVRRRGPQRTRKLVSGPDLRLILHVRGLPLSAPEPVIHWPGITTAELPVATPVHGHAGCH